MSRIADLTLTQVTLVVLAYWAVALMVALAIRRRARPAQPEHYDPVSDTEIVVTFSETMHPGRLVVVAFGPPLVLITVWYLF
jgi:hypothetical protein